VASCDSVRSLREAAAVKFGVEPYRLTLLVGTRPLIDNNANLLACDLPSNGQLSAVISEQDPEKGVHYRVHGCNQSQATLFADVIHRINPEDDKIVAQLQHLAARITEDDEHARSLAADLRAY